MIDMRRQLYAIWARLCAGSLDYIGGADPLPQPLTREEEAELLQKLPTDDGTVRSILIERNLRLVVFIARKFESSGVGLEDLISIGTIGLIKAVNTFDPEKKNKLATYASRCIENEMLMHLRHTARIRYEISLDEPLRKDWDGNELARRAIWFTAAWTTRWKSSYCARRWRACPCASSRSCSFALVWAARGR